MITQRELLNIKGSSIILHLLLATIQQLERVKEQFINVYISKQCLSKDSKSTTTYLPHLHRIALTLWRPLLGTKQSKLSTWLLTLLPLLHLVLLALLQPSKTITIPQVPNTSRVNSLTTVRDFIKRVSRGRKSNKECSKRLEILKNVKR